MTKSINSNNKPKRKKNKFIYAIGRRKTANARVRLFPKKGDVIVNDQPIHEYFSLKIHKQEYEKPFKVTDTLGKYSATIKVIGSGKYGQLGAVIHGLSRALAIADEKKYRPILKKHGLLTRDPRMKERRKAGLAKAARAGKQSPKR